MTTHNQIKANTSYLIKLFFVVLFIVFFHHSESSSKRFSKLFQLSSNY